MFCPKEYDGCILKNNFTALTSIASQLVISFEGNQQLLDITEQNVPTLT